MKNDSSAEKIKDPGNKSKNEKKQRLSLTLLCTAVVFLVLVCAIALAIISLWILSSFGFISGITGGMTAFKAVTFDLFISLIIGSCLSFLLSKIMLKPINDLINKMNCLAAGNFKTRLKFGGIISNHPTFIEISDSFNTLAAELENTEMLRSDFINDFSHEFKTPIVSIAGLAKLVNKGNLTDGQRAQYLTAIEEESLRLSNMATNVLNLTKVENQTILTGVTKFNLSEQIRSAILLFESQWTSKKIDLQIDFDEYMIEANEEQLKQVWINLIGNAVKFVPRCGTVSLEIIDSKDTLKVLVSNTGSEIPPDKQEKIFNKFYQADESHAGEGNGIGLAIVKSITELHGGSVSVKSGNGMTTFTVELPKKQL